MEVAAIIISVVAIGVALTTSGFAVWLQWQMSVASNNQLGEAQKVLAKLEGVSLELRETQREQFSTVLDALIKGAAGDADTRAVKRVAELEQLLEEQHVPDNERWHS